MMCGEDLEAWLQGLKPRYSELGVRGCVLGYFTKNRFLSASRARHTAAGKKKRGISFGMTRCFLFW
jgi:hypothetical protein